MVAAGVWSGELLSQATGEAAWAKALQPRRGHLLELPRPKGMPVVKRGMMEMSYTKVRSVPFHRLRGCRKGAQGCLVSASTGPLRDAGGKVWEVHLDLRLLRCRMQLRC